MSVTYTARQTEVTPKLRKAVESGLSKVNKILGGRFAAQVVFTTEKHLHKVGITILAAGGTIAGVGRAAELNAALAEALEHISTQAAKQKDRASAAKRRVTKSAWSDDATERPSQSAPAMAVGKGKAAVSMVVHKFPGKSKVTESHLIQTTDRVALRPMSLEEAVKEAEFRDHDVFVFRDLRNKVMVLHRTKNGKIEVIEAP